MSNNSTAPGPAASPWRNLSFSDFNLEKTGDGLLPVVVQDSVTLRVLMLGYMDEQALRTTCDTGKVTFYSRTRRCQWTKGETSGNFLLVQDMYVDCDADTLLVKAVPTGPVCHRGTTACFDTPAEEGFVRSLSALVKDRHSQMPDGSYTTKLFIKGVKAIAKKVGEETTECIIEAVDGRRDRFVYEMCDVVYHSLVLLEQMGVGVDELERELLQRHGR